MSDRTFWFALAAFFVGWVANDLTAISLGLCERGWWRWVLWRYRSAMQNGIFTRLLAQANVPQPVAEWRFALPRKYQFDFAWPEKRLALEVEGGVFTRGAHGSISGILRDMEKYNLATLNGWRVLRVLPNKVCDLATIRMIAEAYHSKMGPPVPAPSSASD